MTFCHLARADSLPEICNGLACCLGKLAHLGVGRPPNRGSSKDLVAEILRRTTREKRRKTP